MAAPGRFMPSPVQELLLRACLCPGDGGDRALEAWEGATTLEGLDAGSVRLLPLLYTRVKARGGASGRLEAYQGFYRRSWARTEKLLLALGPALALLEEAGVETLVVKGAALGPLVYEDPAARPMADLDVVVPPEKAQRALELLGDGGWRCHADPRRLAHGFRWMAGTGLAGPEGQSLDLHWHLTLEGLRPGVDRGFWARARGVRIQGVPTRVLDPADQLFHAIVHGYQYDPLPHLRWVADAALVVAKAADRLDWARLARVARQRRLAAVVAHALAYLRDRMDAPVPGEALRDLAAKPLSALDRWDLWFRLRYPDPWGAAPLLFLRFLRATEGLGLAATVRTVPSFLRECFVYEHPVPSVGYVLAKLLSRARRILG